MNKVFFTSDTHFNHTNIIKYTNRPFKDVNEMNRVLIEKWNAKVSPRDTVYFLGDFAMGPIHRWKDFYKVLKGEKILIRGSHDRNAKFMKEDVGFTEIHEKLEVDLGEHGIWLLQHEPMKTSQKLLHGHVHQHWRRLGEWMINVSVDVWDFQPVTIEEMLKVTIDSMEYKCVCGETLKHLEDNRRHYGCK